MNSFVPRFFWLLVPLIVLATGLHCQAGTWFQSTAMFQSSTVSSKQDVVQQQSDKKKFEQKVAPLLIKRCIECHNPTEKSGGLDLSSRESFLAGGDSGEDLSERDIAVNHLFDRVESGEMPPAEKGLSRELAAKEKQVLKEWVEQGSPWPNDRQLDLYEFTSEVRGGRDWWSFQPIKRPTIPRFPGLSNPVDAFIQAKLVERGLSFSPEANKRILFRRISFDTTGLPPDVADSEAFESDENGDAYERLVDRLLASPRFGEHVGRDWLDLVRYADTNGYERDAEKPNGWKFRDWVIDSFNSDKPFDLFVMQQLAGDQMLPLQEENVVGTTMLRVGTWDDEPNDKLEYKYDRLEDLIHVTSTAFLGLTIKCSRCHDHKFDPIPQADYYRMGSIFWPGDLMGNSSDPVKEFDVFSWTDTSVKVDSIRRLKKGNPRQPLEKVDPGFPSVMSVLDTKFAEPTHPSQDTGRRLEFAKRLADPRNPLVARVIVNRIWQHYFVNGIVRTPNNFGYKGSLPTHPELLDWLASELIANGWSLKPIHRMILTSKTYRQSSGDKRTGDVESVADNKNASSMSDPLNLYLSRMNRKRLKAEAIRDSMLSHADQLNLQMGGRGFVPDVSDEALEGLSKRSGAWQVSSNSQQARRGIYLYAKRSLIPPILSSFDFADTTRPCGKRDLTIVAPQALALLNNNFVHEQSEKFASWVMGATDDPVDQIRLAWRRALARNPSDRELKWALAHYREQLAHFSLARSEQRRQEQVQAKVPAEKLVLHLDANFNVQTDADNRVMRWTDRNELRNAFAASSKRAPRLVRKKIDGKSVIEFDGVDQFLEVKGQVITSSEFTIVVVGHDQNEKGHREFFSNWNSSGNSTSSVFMGLTDGRFVRFSDQFRSKFPVPKHPVVLIAVSHQKEAAIFAGHQNLGRRPSGLTGRNLKTKYVLGTQGNFGHEFLNGWIAEILVYDRALSELERKQLVTFLEQKYPSAKNKSVNKEKKFARTPDWLALASVCHVLINANENLFVD